LGGGDLEDHISRPALQNDSEIPSQQKICLSIPIKIPITFITEIKKSTLEFIWKHKRLKTAMAILNKKSNAGSITIPDFKLHTES
jgi:hypothetical protein